ncbi:MAG: OmpA family protein [Acidimicrobiales bacterium]
MGDGVLRDDGLTDLREPPVDPVWDRRDEDVISDSIRASRPRWLIAVPLLLILGAVAMFVITALDEGRGDPASTESDGGRPTIESEDVAEGQADEVQAGSQTQAADGSTDAADDSADSDGSTSTPTGSALPEPPADAPYIDATLTDNIFVLSGVVPDAATKLALEARAELAYAPFNTSQLVVDESVGTADWLGASPEVIGLLPMITDGTIRVQDNEVTLVGRSPNQRWADQFAGAIGSLIDLPVEANGIELTGLVPPRFEASVDNGQVTLTGEIPNQQLIDSFIQGAAAVYGPDNVTSTMTVDDTTYTSFWNYTIPGIFGLLQPFPTYEIRVADAVTSGSMQGAILFELNSADISAEAQQILPIGIALMARDLSLGMKVIGHTDSLGSDAINDALSLRRAESVVAFFVENGIDPGRLVAEGKGSADPIADNGTEEGRARNRRVEFVFGGADAIG